VSSLGDGTGLAHGVVRLAGTASAIDRPNFLELFNSRTGFRDACLRYTGVFLAHVLQTAACNRHHPVEARLARWLLTLSDRVNHDRLRVTHEFCATMLGSDRSTVSIAARSLQTRGLIAQGRGVIRIRCRAGLEALSCECYATVRERLRYLLRSSGNTCAEGTPNSWQGNRPRQHDAIY
jgi:hypothetical protein